MADVFDPIKRRSIMASIRAKDTQPEMRVRKALHRKGYRYRVHVKDLPGCPDLVLRKYNAAIFINGCFWHGHDCHLFRMPSSNIDYWETKISNNRNRDQLNRKLLLELDWRVLTVWECSLKGKEKMQLDSLIISIEDWLKGSSQSAEIRGIPAVN